MVLICPNFGRAVLLPVAINPTSVRVTVGRTPTVRRTQSRTRSAHSQSDHSCPLLPAATSVGPSPPGEHCCGGSGRGHSPSHWPGTGPASSGPQLEAAAAVLAYVLAHESTRRRGHGRSGVPAGTGVGTPGRSVAAPVLGPPRRRLWGSLGERPATTGTPRRPAATGSVPWQDVRVRAPGPRAALAHSVAGRGPGAPRRVARPDPRT
jgi:hypothetical protein